MSEHCATAQKETLARKKKQKGNKPRITMHHGYTESELDTDVGKPKE
jgi:hypothetical protein